MSRLQFRLSLVPSVRNPLPPRAPETCATKLPQPPPCNVLDRTDIRSDVLPLDKLSHRFPDTLEPELDSVDLSRTRSDPRTPRRLPESRHTG